VVVIGDGHARGCAAELTEHAGKSCEVTGFVKPRTGLEVITEMATKEISKLTKKDVVVVWGGTHDIGKNMTKKGLEHLVKFVKQNSHTNIVIMKAPHRHDLSDLSCVNNEVKGFNRKLQKMMKIYNNTEILDVDINREHYTHHGLHMNISGKEKMAKRISDVVKKLLQERRKNLLP
jgi:lysophospholipase L1-like esterase